MGNWVHNQRTAYNKNKLTDEQIRKLVAIGMRFERKRKMWIEMYEQAYIYFQEHGNLNISPDYLTKDGDLLGTWLGNQKQAYKNGKLTDEQISKLEAIGIVWNKYDDHWNKMYELANNYYKEHEDLIIPQKFETKNGDRLGLWIVYQRQAYRNRALSKDKWIGNLTPLTDKQVSMLESIGMVWDTKKNKSDIEEICKDNTIDIKKNKDIINHISFTEFKVKLSYLKDNGINIIDENGLLHEIFSMSSMNMKLKYGVSLEDLVNMYNKGMNK